MGIQKRNVVVFLCDQLRPDFLSIYGCEAVPTPNLDRLARMGVVFDRAITCSPVCAPARASMMTGHYPSRHGVWTNDLPFRPGLEYLPKRMNDLGYATSCFGKMHHFPADDTKGFQFARQMEEGHLWTQEPYLAWLKRRHVDANDLWNFDSRNLIFKLSPDMHYEHWIASGAIQWLDSVRGTGKPFFAWISFQGPHSPLNPPEDVKGTVHSDLLPRPIERKGNEVCPIHLYREALFPAPSSLEEIMRWRTAYAECIVNIDRQIGRILKVLESMGLLEQTTFLFSADHGDLLGDFRLMGKGPFPYGGQLAVPLIAANHPKISKAGRSRHLAGNIDIPGTVLEIAEADYGIGVARSLIDLAQENPQQARAVNFSEFGDLAKIVENKRYRYAYYPFIGISELFDLQEDPREQVNLAGRPEYGETEIKFLKDLNDFAAIGKGVEVEGYGLIPVLQQKIREKHPRFDDPGELKAAFPLTAQLKQNLKKAGLDSNYTNFYRSHRLLNYCVNLSQKKKQKKSVDNKYKTGKTI